MIDVWRKGRNAEKQLCEILSQHFNRPFKRVPYSGAMKSAYKDKELSPEQLDPLVGDIQAPDGMKMVIETKSRARENFSWNTLLSGNYAQLNNWIDQVKNDADDKFWLLCFKTDWDDWFVLFESDVFGFNYIISGNTKDAKYFDFHNDDVLIKYNQYMICKLRSFLSKNSETIAEGVSK